MLTKSDVKIIGDLFDEKFDKKFDEKFNEKFESAFKKHTASVKEDIG